MARTAPDAKQRMGGVFSTVCYVLREVNYTINPLSKRPPKVEIKTIPLSLIHI